MYRVTVKTFVAEGNSIFERELLLFDDSLPEEDLILLEPKLVLEDNDPGTLDFTLPTTHRYYGYKAAKVLNSNGTVKIEKGLFESNTDTVTVYKNGKWYWEGRPTTYELNFNNSKVVHCEGALSYLTDTIQPLKHYSSSKLSECVVDFLKEIIEIHNDALSKMEESTGLSFENRKIYIENWTELGVIPPVPKDISTFDRTTNFENTLETINKRLVSKLGGHVRVRRNPTASSNHLILEYHAECTNSARQSIEFGKNLLDYNRSTDMTEIATVVIPRGDDADESSPFYRKSSWCRDISQRVDLSWEMTGGGGPEGIVPWGDPRIYAAKDVLQEYGYVETIAEFTGIVAKQLPTGKTGWASIKDYRDSKNKVLVLGELKNNEELGQYKKAYLAALRILGVEYLQNLQFDKLKLELSIFDLARLGFDGAEDIELLDNVLCSSAPHGMINKIFPVTKIEVGLDSIDDMTITLGTETTTAISNTAGSTARAVASDPADDDVYSYYKNLINKAKLESDVLIQNAINGHINVIKKPDGSDGIYSDALMITSEPLTSDIIARIQNGESYSAVFRSSSNNKIKNLRYWIWNSGGIAYYDLGQKSDGTAIKIALNANGETYADGITAKKISGYEIDGATITGVGITAWSGRNNTGYFVTLKDGKLIGGYNSVQRGYVDASFSMTDYSLPKVNGNYQTLSGLKVGGKAFAIGTSLVTVKQPSWTKAYEPNTNPKKLTKYINTFTGILRDVASTPDGDTFYWRDIYVVNGLIVTAGDYDERKDRPEED